MDAGRSFFRSPPDDGGDHPPVHEEPKLIKMQRLNIIQRKDINMKHIVTLDTRDMAKSAVKGGCGECQTSCQSACKTSCGVANQACENKDAE